MAGKSRAIVLLGPRQVEEREFPLPDIGPGEALLRVEGCGVCGADWVPYKDGGHGMFKPPLILGHEIVGIVDQIGPDAARRWGVQEGDRVTVEEHLPCRKCEPCRRGHFSGCLAGGSPLGARKYAYGATSIDIGPALWGGYSEYLFVDANAVVTPLSKTVSIELATLFIPISNGMYLVNGVANAAVGSSLVIQGPGQNGLGCVIGAREAEVGPVIIIGLRRDAHRLEVAKHLGADHVLYADEEDVVARVRDITGGSMADTVINCTAGAPDAFETSLDMGSQYGTVITLTGAGRPANSFDVDKIGRKTVKGAGGRDRKAVRGALRLIESGYYPLEEMCTNTFPLEQTELALKTLGWEGEADPIHVSVVNR